MIEYIGPESLKGIVESSWKKIPKGPRSTKETTKIKIGLTHYGIDYKSIGFPDENNYFEEIDSYVNEINNGNIEAYDKFLEIGNGNYILFKKSISNIFSEPDGISKTIERLGKITRGGYSTYTDEIYFDSAYLLSSEDFNETLTHECTHWELGNVEFRKKVRKYYRKGKKIEDGNVIKKILLIPQYYWYVKNIEDISKKEKILKIPAIDEGLAFASSEVDPDFSIYQKPEIPAKDYKRVYEVFKGMLKDKSYGEVIEVAKNIINESWEKEKDAIEVLENSI